MVTASLNQDKSNKDPARWIPTKNRCTYAKAWVSVKARWGLSVDRAEKAAHTRILAKCGGARVLKPGTRNLLHLAGTNPLLSSRRSRSRLRPHSDQRPGRGEYADRDRGPSALWHADVVERSDADACATTVPGAHYATCMAARDAGAAPLHIGQHGYRSPLDGDGVAYET